MATQASDVAITGVHSALVRGAEEQAAMQPWVDMECYQLGAGGHLAQMDSLDMGSQQLVRA